MKYLLSFLGLLSISFAVAYIRYKLSRWEEIVFHFGSVKRPDLRAIYGFWSEFRRTPRSYPLSNQYLKVAVTSVGLYLQYDLKYELIKFYKPVLIPWDNLKVGYSEESVKKGFDEYIILKDQKQLGKIFIQVPVSERIVEEAKKIGFELDFV